MLPQISNLQLGSRRNGFAVADYNCSFPATCNFISSAFFINLRFPPYIFKKWNSMLRDNLYITPTGIRFSSFSTSLPPTPFFIYDYGILFLSINQINETVLENKKYDLLKAVQDTERGFLTTPNQRSEIEETLVDLESYGVGNEAIDLEKLDGTWRLQYTSASDVLVLLDSSSRLPFFQLTYVTFYMMNRLAKYFRNLNVRVKMMEAISAMLFVGVFPDCWSRTKVPPSLFLQNFLSYPGVISTCSSRRSISLQNINISDELQALIAPALLPRSFLTLQILQAIRNFKAQIPVSTTSPGRQSVGGLYYLSLFGQEYACGSSGGRWWCVCIYSSSKRPVNSPFVIVGDYRRSFHKEMTWTAPRSVAARVQHPCKVMGDAGSDAEQGKELGCG
ncbi:hypothetical protein LXL04_010866 [Taraxacum kok-saghyz]